MAETVVGVIIQNLGSIIIQEIKSLGTVRKQLQSIKSELEIIRPFLKNVDEKAAAAELDQGHSNEEIRIWVQQIREEAYRIEYVIDEFTFLVSQLHHGTTGLDGVLPRFYHWMKMMKLRHKIASDIKDIMSSLVGIHKRKKRYDLEESQSGMENVEHDNNGASSYFTKEGQIVGNESIRKELSDWLVDEITQRRVLALVGAGGLGKATLVASVYKWPVARICFDCYAWIEVGRAYSKEDVFRKLLREFYDSRRELLQKGIDTMDSRELIDLLRKYLEEKRYMVVFDDVWKADFWKYVEHALLDNGKANRIFITTRNWDVADFIPGTGDHIRVRVLERLPPDEARQLFCRKVFPGGVCPLALEELSHDILVKCDGLPIAIVAIAGLLSKKNKVHEWKELLSNLGSQLKRDIYLKDCNRVLCESYNDLPYHLKPCLLYFTLFPARYIVECERLIRLWIAEGFVQLQDNKNKLHEVAETYLTELIRRSLVQVLETSIDGKATSVQVHELIHEIIMEKAKQYGFSQVVKEQEQHSIEKRRARRITVHKSTNKVVESIRESRVRSLFLFEIDEFPSTFICTLAIANFKLMKVLDFQGAPLQDNLLKEVGNLFNLRYLSLRKTKVKVLPKSIGKLFNLDTLDLRHTLVSKLPNEIRNLKKLRCLLGGQLDQLDHTYGGMKVQEAIGSLTELEELAFVEANFKAVKELGKLRKLKKLGLRVTYGKGKNLCTSISKMEDLQSLDVESMDQNEVIDLQSIASPPQGLSLLYLTGILKKLPDWISNIQNLVRMRLDRSGLIDDPLKVLHGLPNLMELSLVKAYNAAYLNFAEGWFPKLKSLTLIGFQGLKLMIIDKGAMPLLQSLQIESSPLLKVPTSISNLKNLMELVLANMPNEFVDEIISSQYYCKVFASSIVEGERITEISIPPLSPEFPQTKIGGKDFIPPLLLDIQQGSKDDKEGDSLTDKDDNPPMQLELLETSKDVYEDMKNIEKHTPPVLIELPQTSKEEEGKNIIKKDYDEPKDDEGNNTTKKYYLNLSDNEENPPVLPELQQENKDDKEGENLSGKDNNPPMQPELFERSKDDSEDEKNIEEHTPPVFVELPQTSKDGEGTNILEKDYGEPEDDEGKNTIKKDYSSPVLLEPQHGSKDDMEKESLTDKDDNPPMQPELLEAGKDDNEDIKNMEKHTPPVPVELPQTSKDEEGANIIKKDYGGPVLLELAQTSKDEEERKKITEKDRPVKSEPKQPSKQFAKNVANWTRQSDVPKDEEGKSMIEKEHNQSVLTGVAIQNPHS